MEQDDLRYLDDGAQEAYNAFQRRFESEDWKTLIEWADEQASAAAASQLAATSWDQVLISRGKRLAYIDIINLETSIENQFLNLVAEAKEMSIAKDEEDAE